MAASDGGIDLFLARDLFMQSRLVYELLEDHVKYVAADLKSHSFINTLRIRESVGVDGMINEMKQWSAALRRNRRWKSTQGLHNFRCPHEQSLFVSLRENDRE